MKEKNKKDVKSKSKKKINKKKLIIGGSIGVSLAALGITAYLFNKKGSSNSLKKYTNSFFKKASLEELSKEREIVRQKYASSGINKVSDKDSNAMYELLNKFDTVISNRKNKKHGIGFPVHREHGWHLPSDD